MLGAQTATTFLVAARRADDAVGIFAVPAGQARVTAHRAVDVTRRLGTVDFDGVTTDAVIHAPGPDGERAYRRMVAGALFAITAEAVGGVCETLRRTVDYAGVRHQFDRPIASFQVIKHRLADIHIDVQRGSVALELATAAVEAADLTDLGCAKAQVTEAYARAVRDALQTHGGIGYTWEHDIHLFLKRAELDAALFGSARHHLLAATADVAARAGTPVTEQQPTEPEEDNHA